MSTFKVEPVVPLKHRQYPRAMTLCIAAKAVHSIVLCADTSYWHSSLTDGIVGLLSGNVARARELAEICRKSFDEPRVDFLQCLRECLGKLKHGIAETLVQGRLGVSYEDFLCSGKEWFSEEVFSSLNLEIAQTKTGVEMIVSGFFNSEPVIAKISDDDVVLEDHFSTIGSGSYIAEASLYSREQSKWTSRNTTLYQLYEAKRLGEKAPGVGRQTFLATLTFVNGYTMLSLPTPECKAKLAQKFEELSVRPAPDSDWLSDVEDFDERGVWPHFPKSDRTSDNSQT